MKTHLPAIALLETVVAVVVLSIALTVAAGFVSVGLKSVDGNKRKLVALYLAEECLELVRNVRDSAQRQDLRWYCAFPNEGRYSIEVANFNALSEGTAPDCQTELGVTIASLPSGALGTEIVFGGQRTSFHRFLSVQNIFLGSTIDQDTAPDIQEYTCTVTWGTKNQESLSLTQQLTNWNR